MCSNHQVSTKLPVFPTTSETCDSYPLVLQECSPTMCHQTGAYQAVGLDCYYIKCHCFILPVKNSINFHFFPFVLCANCTGFPGCTG